MEPATLALATKTTYVYHATVEYIERRANDGQLGWGIGIDVGYEMFVTEPPALAEGDTVKITVEKA